MEGFLLFNVSFGVVTSLMKGCLCQSCVRSFLGDTRKVVAPGPAALHSGEGVVTTGAISEPTLDRFIYEVPGVDSIE